MALNSSPQSVFGTAPTLSVGPLRSKRPTTQPSSCPASPFWAHLASPPPPILPNKLNPRLHMGYRVIWD